jgi:AcrR family transcriptional regulator
VKRAATAKLPRRTQKERREATIQKLLDATIAALLEVGYTGTTVKEICTRAGVSHGGLFRFFPSVLDLVLAAGEEVARRHITEFERRFQRSGKESLKTALELLREACRSKTNAVFYELLVAARTDPALQKALEDPMRRYYDAIRRTAARVPGMDGLSPELLDVLLFSIIHMFDGETLARAVLPMPEVEAKRLELLGGLISQLFPGRR